MTVDLNESPSRVHEEHLKRMRALTKTVELGKRYFPRCSEVLNRIVDASDFGQLSYVRNDTPEEQQRKKQRYMELQEDLCNAFNEDKQEFEKSAVASSSSYKATEAVRSNRKLLTNKRSGNVRLLILSSMLYIF
ncbi:BTB/POZ domain and ankyrin repeat-containing protein NPR1 [Euphorbia peplus]|nr:BTB/POZ domain and ankyrin repeat-containing protein NPR1 [Euphorbia peplus]